MLNEAVDLTGELISVMNYKLNDTLMSKLTPGQANTDTE